MVAAKRHLQSRLEIDSAIVAIEDVVGRSKRPVALHEPFFAGHEWDYVKETIDSGWVSSVGRYVDEFEERLAQRCEMRFAIATMNGTAALHACMLILGVESNDEVLVPALTFVATANAVSYCGAIPHFCDAEEVTLGIDPEKLERHLTEIAEVSQGSVRNRQTGRRLAAIVPMHTFGQPTDMERLVEVCKRWSIPIIEDAAEALGSTLNGRHVGSHGRVAALSFNGNKIVTTGGGGAVLTNDAALARAMKHLTTTAKQPHQWAFIHDQMGFNYRLPNINAALGCAQLEQLDTFVSAKRRLAQRYQTAFENISGARILSDRAGVQSNYWLVAMLLDEPDLVLRDEFLAACHARGLLCRPSWTCMHRLPMFGNAPRMDLAMAEALEARIVDLPSSMTLELNR